MGGSVGCFGHTGAPLTVHYFPLEAETLTAVTAENILKRSGPCVLTSSQDVGNVNRLLDSAEPTTDPFGGSFVRLRVDVQTDGKSQLRALMDQEGVVRDASGGVRRLRPERLRDLVAFINAHCS
jgi:hypothetical protein